MPCTIPCFTLPYTFIEHALGCKFYNSSNIYMVLAKGSLNCRGKTRQVWRMAIYRKWLVSFRRKLDKSPRTTVVLLHIAETDKNPELEEEEEEEEEEEAGATREENEKQQVEPVGILLSAEDLAAIKVQACFRGHLARRAYRALKSLVKLQALVRGVSVRRQARIALHCMRTLVKLQVRVRTRQLLTLVDINRNVQC